MKFFLHQFELLLLLGELVLRLKSEKSAAKGLNRDENDVQSIKFDVLDLSPAGTVRGVLRPSGHIQPRGM